MILVFCKTRKKSTENLFFDPKLYFYIKKWDDFRYMQLIKLLFSPKLNLYLILGYSISYDYLREINKNEEYLYERIMMDIFVLKIFHITGISLVILSALLWSMDSFSISVVGLVGLVLFIVLLFTFSIKRKYPFGCYLKVLRVQNSLNSTTKRKILGKTSLFFIFNLLVLLVVELPMCYFVRYIV